jgi:RNA polymerase sigma-54 factor
MARNVQVQTAKQSQRINTKQIQFLNFLFLNQNELEGYISKEMLENPFLEVNETGTDKDVVQEDFTESGEDFTGEMRLDEIYSRETLEDDAPDYRMLSNNYAANDWSELSLQRHAEQEDITDLIMDQVRFLDLSEEGREVAHFIVNSADEKGFLETDLESFVDYLGFATGKFYDEEFVLQIKKEINCLEPLGFACFDLQDYFITLVNLDEQASSDQKSAAIRILEEHYEDFKEANWFKIQQTAGVSRETIDNVLKLIAGYKPYPTKGFGREWLEIKNEIVPDYEITLIDGELKGELAQSKRYNFSVDAAYASSMQGAKNTGAYINEKLKSAYWLIDAIQQREETMEKVIRAIVHLQKDYLLTGDSSKLRPMILKDIATYIDMNISTVSRVTSNKYARSPIGLIHLKDLFSEAIYLEDGSRKSNKEVQDMVIRLVQEEDKNNPLSDFDIQKALKLEGINLTRRTVTKYRLSENIPSSKERKVS